MADHQDLNTEDGKSAAGVSRRDFLVMLGGATLGTFVLPAVASTAAVPTKQQLPVREILIVPTRQSLGGDNFMLVWTEQTASGAQSMVWHPETAEEKQQAQKFYEAARDFEPDTLLSRATDWLGGLFSGKKRSAEELALLRGIIDTPGDPGPALRYADWLVAQGNPQGEFIQVDCAMEGMKASDPRYPALSKRWTQLYEQIGGTLVKPLAKVGIKPTVAGQPMPSLFLEQGLVVTVDIEKPSVIPRRVKQLFEAAPLLREISLDGEGIDVVGLAACAEFQQIKTLTITSCDLSDQGVEALTKSPHLGRLTSLSLSYNPLSEEATKMLADSPLISQLKTLELNGCDLSFEAIDALLKSPRLGGLEKLNLSFNNIDDEGPLHLLSQAQHLTSLKDLNLSSNELTRTALEYLAQAPFFRQLEVLDLGSCKLEADALEVLRGVEGTHMKNLNLASNKLGAEGFQMLASLSLLATVESLTFEFCNMTDDDVIALVQSPHLGYLKILNLGYNRELNNRVAQAIASCPKLNKLEELLLGNSQIGAEGVAALAQSSYLGELQRLEFNEDPIGAEGALALAASPHFKELTNLVVTESEVKAEGKAALVKRFGDTVSCW